MLLILLLVESNRFGSEKPMKTKEELLGDYREMTENNALQKDIVFLEVLIDIRDALVGNNKSAEHGKISS